MKAGKVKVSNKLINEALQFPDDWHIIDIKRDTNSNSDVFIMTISGAAFPDWENDQEPKECRVIIHKENLRFEVKEIEKTI